MLSGALPSFPNVSTSAPPITSTASSGLISGNNPPLGIVPLPLNTTQTTTQMNPDTKTGLGGFDINTSQTKKGDGSSDTTKTKDSQVPNEILITIEQLKNYIKQQKSESSDIARSQSRKLTIQNEIQTITLNIQDISNTLDNFKATAKILRNDTSRLIRHVELAQRTYEIPAGLQFENSAPLQFFMEMTHKNENELLTLKNLITTVENHMHTLSSPQHLSVEALKSGFHQLHESFIALAGRLYKIHQQVNFNLKGMR